MWCSWRPFILNHILRNIEKGQGACGLRANLGCPAAAVPMRVLRGRAPLASCASMRRRGAELNAKFHHQLCRIWMQLAARTSSTTSGAVPLPLAVAHTCRWSETSNGRQGTARGKTRSGAPNHKLNIGRLARPITGQSSNCRRARYCLLYTSPSPRDGLLSRMPSSA